MSTRRKMLFFGLPFLTFGTMYYSFPELRYSYSELGKGFMRVFRVAWAGLRMAMIYYFGYSLTSEEKHEKSAKILKKAFEKNGGVYLKFG